MSFLWCIPVFPVVSSISYYAYQLAAETQDRRALTKAFYESAMEVIFEMSKIIVNGITSEKHSMSSSSSSSSSLPEVAIPRKSSLTSLASNDDGEFADPPQEWDATWDSTW